MSRKPVIVPLTTEEAASLAEHELIISQGLNAFVEVGLALLDIRDRQLYRIEHKTFEDYCQKRWHFGARRGEQLMAAALLADEMRTSGSGLEIENERQARALAAVPPHLRAEVIEQAKSESEKLTEQVVTRIVCRLLDEKRAAAAEQRSAPAAEEEPQEDEGEEPEEDVQPDVIVDESEPTTSSTLRRAAKKAEKERLYLPRGLEHLRLAVKDFLKIVEGDLETKDARQSLREGLNAADEAFSRVRLMAMNLDKK